MPNSPAAAEPNEPETPAAAATTMGDGFDASPWLRAKSAAESLNLQAVMEDMEHRYTELRQERDSLQEKVQAMTTEKESLISSQASLESVQQEKAALQNKIQQEEIKNKGLAEEKVLIQERMDRMQAEKDLLQEELE